MNGRCHKDALDRAEDICELCGHQFCAHCVLYPRGRRNPPTCKACALANSGLRGSSGKGQPISKREYKKRKKALLETLEATEEEQPALQPFQLHDPSAFDQSNELDRRIQKLEAEPPIDILASDSDEADSPTPPAPSAPPPSAPPPSAPEPAVSPVSKLDEAVSGLAPVDTSVNPLALREEAAPPPPPAATPATAVEATPTDDAPTSAAELLARLKADQPIQSQFHQSTPSFDVDPFASESTGDLVGHAPPAAAAPLASPAAEAFAQTAPRTPPPTAPTPPPPPSEPKSGTWSPPPPPPRGTVLEGPVGNEAVVDEPVVNEPATQDRVVQAPVVDEPTQPEDVPGPGARADEPEPGDAGTPARRRADTDDAGQWIPPSLRGMAAPEEREPLPKRR